jgi:hypothetical protein
MQNRWTMAGLGILALGAIVGMSTLTTAYLLRPPVGAPDAPQSTPAPAPEPRAPVVRVALPGVARPAARAASARPVSPAVTGTPAAPAAAGAPDCDTGAARIAQPGALAAGLGAQGCAMANGGKGAGR